MKTVTPIEHFDHLGQSISPGDYVSFTWANSRRLYIGRVLRLTKQRIKIVFNYSFVHNGKQIEYTSSRISRPEDCLVLSENLQQQLTLATLQKKI
jgi:hypothetical protein